MPKITMIQKSGDALGSFVRVLSNANIVSIPLQNFRDPGLHIDFGHLHDLKPNDCHEIKIIAWIINPLVSPDYQTNQYQFTGSVDGTFRHSKALRNHSVFSYTTENLRNATRL